MPSSSKAQHNWVASEEGLKALGAEKQREWLKADEGLNLPDRVEKSRHEGASPKARHRLNLKSWRNWMKG